MNSDDEQTTDKDTDSPIPTQAEGDKGKPVPQRDAGHESGDEGEDPSIPQELLEPTRKMVTEVTEITAAAGFVSGPMTSPWPKQITSEHITQLIDTQGKHSERGYVLHREGRRYKLIYVIIGVIVASSFAYLTIPDHSDIFMETVKAILTAGLGFFRWLGIWQFPKTIAIFT